MKVVIEIEAPDNLALLSKAKLDALCAVCGDAENRLRSFAIKVQSARINKEHEAFRNDKNTYTRPAPSPIKKRVRDEEEDEIESMEDWLG